MTALPNLTPLVPVPGRRRHAARPRPDAGRVASTPGCEPARAHVAALDGAVALDQRPVARRSSTRCSRRSAGRPRACTASSGATPRAAAPSRTGDAGCPTACAHRAPRAHRRRSRARCSRTRAAPSRCTTAAPRARSASCVRELRRAGRARWRRRFALQPGDMVLEVKPCWPHQGPRHRGLHARAAVRAAVGRSSSATTSPTCTASPPSRPRRAVDRGRRPGRAQAATRLRARRNCAPCLRGVRPPARRMTAHGPRDLDLGVIGNCEVAALVDARRRIVWGCLPRLDGDPVFCALLDGRRRRCAAACSRSSCSDRAEASQRYLRNTAMLETDPARRPRRRAAHHRLLPALPGRGRMFRPMMFVRLVEPLAGRPVVRIRLRPASSTARRARAAAGARTTCFHAPTLASADDERAR